MQRGCVSGHGLELAYRAWGRGAAGGGVPLVLLHGLTGSSADWTRVAERLDGARPVIALDARGHGESGWSAEEAYVGDAHFADLVSALDGLGIGRCLLAGYSMGGGVAILAAGALPERVAGVVVVDSYPAPEMTAGSRLIAEMVAGTWWGAGGARPGFDPAIARRIAADLAAGDARRLDLWPFWEALQCPALVVRGAESDVLPAALANEMLRRQPSARLATIAGVGHQLPFYRPAELADEIGRFAGGLEV